MTTKKIIREIKLLAERVPEGKNYAFECPFCMATHERKFYITREGGSIRYICLRASCGERGVLTSDGRQDTCVHKESLRTNPILVQTRQTNTLPTRRCLTWLYQAYGTTDRVLLENGLRCCHRTNSLVFPIYHYNTSGVEGYYYKQLPPELETEEYKGPLSNLRGRPTKCMLYWETDNFLGIYIPINSSIAETMVVVEDPLSAIKVSQLHPTLALLGTNLKEDTAAFLHQNGVRKLIWMLDADATDKSLKFSRKYALMFDSKIVPMKKDPKDTPIEELKCLL